MSKHSALALVLRNSEKNEPEILLVCEDTKDKSDPKESWRWSLPGGKCCKTKDIINKKCCFEKPEETALRELLEETGFKGHIIKLINFRASKNPETGRLYDRFTYLATIIGGRILKNPTPQGDTSPKWFLISALPPDIFYSHKEIIENFFSHKK